jgi:hypothetical protein
VLDVVGEETQVGFKTPAPSHSFAAAMNSDEAEKRRELAEEMKNLEEFLKRNKVWLVQRKLAPMLSAPVLIRRLADPSDRSQPRMTSVGTLQTMGSCSCPLSCATHSVHWMLQIDRCWRIASLRRIGCTARARIQVDVFVNSCRKRWQIQIECSRAGTSMGDRKHVIRNDLKKSTKTVSRRTWA